jgi:predicted metalloendopeptidase
MQPSAPRDAQGVAIANNLLGEAVGYLYVRRTLSPAMARQVRMIFEDVQAGLRERILPAAWMDDATRKGALAKVDSLRLRLGEAGAAPPDLTCLHLDPREVRVNAVVRNVDAWYAAFGVQPGAKLYLPPAQRVRF